MGPENIFQDDLLGVLSINEDIVFVLGNSQEGNDMTKELNDQLMEECKKENSDVEEIKALINAGADVDPQKDKSSGYSSSPLHIAVSNGNEGLARVLLENGADIDSLDSMGLKPLDVSRDIETARCLIDHGASKDSIVLYNAIDNAEMFKYLVDSGVSINSDFNHGILYKVLFSSRTNQSRDEVIEFLVKKGCDLNRVEKISSFYEASPLHMAIMLEDPRSFALFLENGAELYYNNIDIEATYQRQSGGAIKAIIDLKKERLNACIEYIDSLNLDLPIPTDMTKDDILQNLEMADVFDTSTKDLEYILLHHKNKTKEQVNELINKSKNYFHRIKSDALVKYPFMFNDQSNPRNTSVVANPLAEMLYAKEVSGILKADNAKPFSAFYGGSEEEKERNRAEIRKAGIKYKIADLDKKLMHEIAKGVEEVKSDYVTNESKGPVFHNKKYDESKGK